MTIRLLGVLVLVALLSIPALGDWERGWGAYQKGDYVTAAREFRAAAEQGSMYAKYMLGGMYREGQGIPKNEAEAVRWYRAAADQGHIAAASEIGLTDDEVPFFVALRRRDRVAAEQGDAGAQFNLGNGYLNGEGVLQDYDEAVRWYRAAADQGHARAQFYLALMYENGQGVPQNGAEAVRWYRAAAEQGDAGAQLNLGYTYGGGRGVPKNLVLAYKWSSLAAARGWEDAQTNLGLFEKQMTPEQIAEAQRLAAEAWERIQAGS